VSATPAVKIPPGRVDALKQEEHGPTPPRLLWRGGRWVGAFCIRNPSCPSPPPRPAAALMSPRSREMAKCAQALRRPVPPRLRARWSQRPPLAREGDGS